MSFGFGLGLPHYVAVLGGSTPPVGPVYYFSLSIAPGTDSLYPITISVDSSDNAYVVGGAYDIGTSTQNWYVLKLTSSGALSGTKKIAPNSGSATGSPRGILDASNNLYVFGDTTDTCNNEYMQAYKLNSSLSVTTSETIEPLSGYQDSGPYYVVFDSSGNIWIGIYNYLSGQYIQIRLTTALGPLQGVSLYYASCYYYVGYGAVAATSTGNLIGAGYFYDYSCCCVGAHQSAILQSFSASTGTTNWTKIVSAYAFNYFNSVVVDSSDNIYANFNGTIFKFGPTGTLLAQTTINGASSGFLKLDSSGNIYYAYSITTHIAGLVKLTSSLVLTYSRTIAPTTAGEDLGIADMSISSNAVYLNTRYSNAVIPSWATLVIKIPTDGSLTQTVTVGGYNFNYAVGSATQSTPSYSFNSTSAIPVAAGGTPTTSAAVMSVSTYTPTTAVTVL